MGRRHERGHLFMAHLNKFNLVFPKTGKATQQAIDPITRIPEDAAHAPLMQPFPEEITDCLSHRSVPRDVQR